MFGGIGMQEILIVLIVGLLVFGAARLPKIARSLGLGIKEFKKTVKGLDDDSEDNQIKYVQNQPPISQQYNPGMQQPGFTPNPQYNQNQPGGAGQPQATGAGADQPAGQPQTPGSGLGQAGTQPQSPGQVGVPPQAPGQAMNQNQPQAPGQATNQNQPQGDQQQSDDNQQNA